MKTESTFDRYLAFRKAIEAELEAKRPKTSLELVENHIPEFNRSRTNLRKVELPQKSKAVEHPID